MGVIVEIFKYSIIISLFIFLIIFLIKIAYLYDNYLLNYHSIPLDDIFLSKKKIIKKYSKNKTEKELIHFMKIQKGIFYFIFTGVIITILLL
ncbi:hypothetical protein CXF68_15100 [Tenacibaculum sp. Bg11-29]|uniref:hypothetical protein n=1 Tax=Tenacibaculum sp. Bg11-29 TaxID=2058306 RepID=UPI000C3395DA|nr:hypothetical protein [Tenacibaculum sp. Bg11-29]PKH51935.1 hypothetical protein CXF68_15100 [Tenacibaculum sp. Bg11-29]